MDIYETLRKVTSSALFLLAICLVFASIDHFYFDEAFRATISAIGIFALVVFFIGILATVIKGASDKSKND